jgi:transposase
MAHVNAILAPKGWLMRARCVVVDGWPLRRAAERFQVSATTASRWAASYRDLGETGMVDRSSRPIRSPQRSPERTERRIIAVRVNGRWGPARIGYLLGIHPSTVHKVLTRYGLAKLAWLDRATGRVIRRYEHEAPWDLVHVDIKKLGRIPDGGGHRVLDRGAGNRNKTRTEANRRPGYAYLHNAVDDHSRLAYTEILTNEKRPLPGSGNAPTPTSRVPGSRSNASSRTTAPATAPMLSPTPWEQRSPTNAPAPTGLKPTAKSNASTAPCSRNGPTLNRTDQKANAPQHSPTGGITIITNEDTPHSKASHQPTAYPTSVGNTPSGVAR